MSVGAGIFLIALGAILSFAVRDNWDVMDLTVVGYILMGAGALMTVLGVFFMSRKRKAETIIEHAPTAGGHGSITREESRLQ